MGRAPAAFLVTRGHCLEASPGRRETEPWLAGSRHRAPGAPFSGCLLLAPPSLSPVSHLGVPELGVSPSKLESREGALRTGQLDEAAVPRTLEA